MSLQIRQVVYVAGIVVALFVSRARAQEAQSAVTFDELFPRAVATGMVVDLERLRGIFLDPGLARIVDAGPHFSGGEFNWGAAHALISASGESQSEWQAMRDSLHPAMQQLLKEKDVALWNLGDLRRAGSITDNEYRFLADGIMADHYRRTRELLDSHYTVVQREAIGAFALDMVLEQPEGLSQLVQEMLLRRRIFQQLADSQRARAEDAARMAAEELSNTALELRRREWDELMEETEPALRDSLLAVVADPAGQRQTLSTEVRQRGERAEPAVRLRDLDPVMDNACRRDARLRERLQPLRRAAWESLLKQLASITGMPVAEPLRLGHD